MSSIDRYLSELRSHLADLDPKRVDEIVAEARSHLESRVEQLRAAGMGEDDAVREALAAFGDAPRMAQDLLHRNSSHRRPVTLRIVVALTVGCGSMFAVNTLINSQFVRWEIIAGTIMPFTGFGWTPATELLELALMVPPLLLVGMVGGRRFWWLAAAPVPVAAVWAAIDLLLHGVSDGRLAWGRFLAGAFPWTIIAATVFLGAAWLGARASTRTKAGTAAALLSGLIVVGLWLAALASPQAARPIGGLGADPQDYGIAVLIVLSAVIPFLVAARRDRCLSRDAFLAGMAVLCAIGLLSVLVLSFAFSGEGRYSLADGYRWLTIAAVACGLGLFSSLIYWRRTQPEPPSGQANLSAD